MIKTLHHLLAACLLFLWLPIFVQAGPEDHYRNPEGFSYYDVWWREARADQQTALLLHGGRPQEHPWTRPGNARAAKNKPEKKDDLIADTAEDLLDDVEPGGALGGFVDDIETKREVQQKQRHGRQRDQEAPAGKLFDYSPNLGVVNLPQGVRRVADGRFGAGLEFAGQGGIRIRIGKKGGRDTIDGWFKPAARPKQPVWLLGTRDGAQLHLLPDGRVQASWYADGRAETRMRIAAKAPIAIGEWSHISCYVYRNSGHHKHTELRLGVNGRIAARHQPKSKRYVFPPLARAGDVFCIGADPGGKQAYSGLMDDVRVTMCRRYCVREDWPSFDAVKHTRPIPPGPPLFAQDSRVFHLGFETRKLTVSRAKAPALTWDVDFARVQRQTPFGKGILVDPALGLPQAPITGMSPHEGTLELWLQPVNWDNNSVFGERMSWNGKYNSVVRFYGRDKRNGKSVVFMEAMLPRASMFGGKGWLQPGTWSHFVWSWSPEDVLKEDGWGNAKAGDPVGAFRGVRFGVLQWRAMLKRDTRVMNHVEPTHLEIGIPQKYKVYHGQRPAILIDEIICHSKQVPKEKLEKATAAWYEKHRPAAAKNRSR